LEFYKISDLQKGASIVGFYLVRNMSIKTSSNNKQYGDYTLADATGEINAKLWDVADPSACPDIGDFIKVAGLVTEWQGKLQLRMDKIRPATDDDPVTLADIVPSAPEGSQAMLAELKSYVSRIHNQSMASIVRYMLNQKHNELIYYPAAVKNHHSIRSGLLYHTLSMLRMADGALKVYTFLNEELLISGIILHDLAKIDEIQAGSSGVALKYTTDGMLLGHIVEGIVEIENAGKEVGADPEAVRLLQHMILAHHYEPEYGSPKRPMFPEAEMLHYLDVIDARMFDMNKILSDMQPGEFSDNIWLLHNRKLYKTEF